MTTQVFNPEQVDALAAHFPRRTEPNFAWGNAMSLMSNLPMLRGLWGFGSVDENGALFDGSGQGRTLSNNGTVPFGISVLAPYGDFTAVSNHYFDRADEGGLDINNHLTWGGWFYMDAKANAGLIGKWNDSGGGGGVNQQAYALTTTAAGAINALVSGNGSATVSVVSSVSYVANTWYHIVGRYTPSVELAIFVNGTKDTNVVGIPAAIFNSNAGLEIGRIQDTASTNYLDGRVSLCFLCNAALPDYMINGIYWHTKRMYGA